MPKPKKRPTESPTIRAARRELIKRLKAVGRERDQLRALKDDLEDLENSCSDAYESLESAIEALSRYT